MHDSEIGSPPCSGNEWTPALFSSLCQRFAFHRHKAHGQHAAPLELAALFSQQDQLLARGGRADRNYHAATVFELINQGLWHVVWRARDDDSVERSYLGPAFVTIPGADLDVCKTESLQIGGGTLGQVLNNLDRENLRDQP